MSPQDGAPPGNDQGVANVTTEGTPCDPEKATGETPCDPEKATGETPCDPVKATGETPCDPEKATGETPKSAVTGGAPALPGDAPAAGNSQDPDVLALMNAEVPLFYSRLSLGYV